MGLKPRKKLDEHMVERIRAAFSGRGGVTERRMFGGVCFMVNGNMAVGVETDRLMVRVGPDAWEDTLSLPHARVMDFTGRPMRGFVWVDKRGLATEAALAAWIERGSSFARSLPAK